MSQTWDIDLIVPASTSPATDIQRIIDGFLALRSLFSGASEPGAADRSAYMLWADTTTGLLKIRNAADSAWITIGTLASTNLGLLALAGGNLTGGVNDTKTTVASATTPDIFATTVGNVVDYTGTTTATGFATAPQAGARRTLICAAAAPFTAGANLLIDGVPSGQTYTATAGERIEVVAVTTTQFRLRGRSSLFLKSPVATTSGTSISVTGIPSGVKRITIMFKGVSTNGTTGILVKVGDSGGIESSGYVGSGGSIATSTALASNSTAGFLINSFVAANAIGGSVILSLEDPATFTWVAQGVLSEAGYVYMVSGRKSLSAELDRIAIDTVNGVDTFDAGEISVSYE